MATKPQSGAAPSSPSSSATGVRDALTELTERAQVISKEASTKVAAAMRDAVSSAAGVAGFALESARDLVQYMVRRGQMTAEEGERIIREAEHAHAKRAGKKGGTKAAATKSAAGSAKPTSKPSVAKAAKPKAKAKKR